MGRAAFVGIRRSDNCRILAEATHGPDFVPTAKDCFYPFVLAIYGVFTPVLANHSKVKGRISPALSASVQGFSAARTVNCCQQGNSLIQGALRAKIRIGTGGCPMGSRTLSAGVQQLQFAYGTPSGSPSNLNHNPDAAANLFLGMFSRQVTA